MRCGCRTSDFLDKPFRFDEFDLRVDRLLVREPPQVQRRLCQKRVCAEHSAS
ncbi:MAG: hypothetical protein U0787_02430 [Polyangia bacterium]